MSTKIVNVLGFVENNDQFVVKTENFKVRISNNVVLGDQNGPSPVEFLLAGFAGSINAVGHIVARELKLDLKALQVEISGELETSKIAGMDTNSRPGLKCIEVVVKPTTDAPLVLLKQWIDTVKDRCPLRDSLLNTSSVLLTLVKEYNQSQVS
ncbi:OsmC family protein [Flavobacterium cerinum]|uniref:OsmC family protein n=1 Tax=Flavobacterium cerinum TaxID=2502784 RepID=A0ABY5IVG3_9FLAO|nr:OsmC family protein [Flavobacterium cerinum]UUC46815.1 OsmC family protein [Flavobacterium cerinum]